MRRALALAVVAAAVVAWLVAGLVTPEPGSAVAAVSRVGGSVRLLTSHGWLPWPLYARQAVAERRLELPVTVATPDGQTGLTVELQLAGNGRLPVAASRVRALGLAAALGEALQPKVAGLLGKGSADGWAREDPLWRQIFPAEAASPPLAVKGAVEGLFAGSGVQVVAASATLKLDPAVVRRAAAERVRKLVADGPRVVVVGLDGVDWQHLGGLLERGRMPALARFLGRAARGVLETPQPLISPPIWTTMATGVPPEVHGVLDFLTTDPSSGEVRPVASTDRQVPAAWNMLSALGLEVGVVGWWATWPAEPVTGFLVSDRVTDVLVPFAGGLEGAVQPAELVAELPRLRTEADSVGYDLASRFVTVPRSAWGGSDETLLGLRRVLASTLTVERCSRELGARYRPRLLMAYFEGTDTIGHLFAPYAPPRRPAVSEADFARFGGAGEAYFAWLDGLVAPLLAAADEETTVILVSDHGFYWDEERPAAAAGPHTATAALWHRREGIIAAAGRGVAAGASGRVRPADLLPTVAALLGLPPDPAWAGRRAAWLLTPELAAAGAVVPAVSYAALVGELKRPTLELPAAERDAVEEKLKALGYLASDSPKPRPTPALDAAMVEARRLNNLGSSLKQAGRREEAERAYRDAIAAAPEYPAPRYNLMLLLFERGEYDTAEKLFWSAVDRNLRDREESVVQLALAYLEKGEARRALSVLAEGSHRFPSSYVIAVNTGTVLGQGGDRAGAAVAFSRAIELNPQTTVARNNLALILADGGAGVAPDRTRARRLLEESLRIDPTQEQVREMLKRLE